MMVLAVIVPIPLLLWIAIPAISAVAYALLLYLRGFRWRDEEPAGRWLLIFLVTATAWSLSSMILHALPLAPPWVTLLVRFVGIANMALPLSAYAFVTHYLALERAQRFILPGLVAYIGVAALTLGGYVVRDARVEGGLIYQEWGWGVVAVAIYWTALMYTAMFLVVRAWRRTQHRDYRLRLGYLGLALFLLIVGNSANVFFSAYPVDQLFAATAAVLMAINLTRESGLGLYLSLQRGFILVAALLVYVVGFAALVYLLSHLSRSTALLVSVVIAIVSAALLLSYVPVRQRVVQWVEHYLFGGLEVNTLLYRLTAVGTRLRLPEDLGRDILTLLTASLPVRQAGLVVRNEMSGTFRPVATVGLPAEAMHVTFAADSPFIKVLAAQRQALTLEHLAELPLARGMWIREWEALKTLQAHVIVPIRAEGDLIGFITLGPRVDDIPFSRRDLERVLPYIAQNIAILLDNARLYAHVQAEADMLARVNAELRELDRMKTELIQNVSHELRTPLTLILGYADLLRQRFLSTPEEIEEAGQVIHQNAKHLLHLVEQLLSFQRLEKADMPLRPFALAPFLENVARAWKPTLEASNLSLEVDIAANVGEVIGNEDYLRQVLDNLLENARKFSPAGGTITLRAWREDDEVYVSVRDQGIGVPPDKLEVIFERFYQVDGSSKRKYGGMGIGLALCKEIIERHGGRIWAESEGQGRGLTITFTLPTTPQKTEMPSAEPTSP